MQSSVSYAEPVNGFRDQHTLIGTVTTTESREHRIGYETASWYTLVDVPAGTYDVILSEGLGSKWVLVRYAGTITDEHFVNRVFQYSSVAEKKHIGEPRSATAQLSPYVAAEMFAAEDGWELAEDWKLASTQHTYSDGRPHALWALVAPDGETKR